MTRPLPDRERDPLPGGPWSLPAPGAAWEGALDAGLDALGVGLAAGVRRALDAHTRLLLAWTGSINLTSVRAAESVARLHLVDSLSAVPLLRRESGSVGTLLDLGSGGGLPGLPLGLALPARRVALVESVAKKGRFLEVVAAAAQDALAAAGEVAVEVEVVVARAEELARRADHRGAWDVVTVRAVGALAELVELAMPLLRVGGLLVAWKRDDGTGALAAEIGAAQGVGRVVGAGAAQVHADPEPTIPGHRLVALRKERATPDRYPRDPAGRRRPTGC